MSKKFIKLIRHEDSHQILPLIEKHPNAFLLLTVIALRARRTLDPVNGLDVGQCYLGDYRHYGMTEQKYRTAKKHLEKLKIVTFQATNKGTIAKIVTSDIYDINGDQDNDQSNDHVTTRQRPSNDQVTTNIECNNVIMKKWEEPPTASPTATQPRPGATDFLNFLKSKGTVVDQRNIQAWSAVWSEILARCQQPLGVLSWAANTPDALKYIRIKEPRFFLSDTWQPLTTAWIEADKPVTSVPKTDEERRRDVERDKRATASAEKQFQDMIEQMRASQAAEAKKRAEIDEIMKQNAAGVTQ